jgi:hypothetical protein
MGIEDLNTKYSADSLILSGGFNHKWYYPLPNAVILFPNVKIKVSPPPNINS